ncbi:GntR family transcriptional regulator [Microlunatus endophyticus]|uniref:GntR family transcriptional regulator n=1 Tax=Microlunatus endophyticus TaxID=1716077 RepID=A0A917SGV7_9ACTN|nr:PLP-dependent aminotransferase family protein [Microlunatus endophyticus]GGL81838.1 GntR family transcriptional regulator [Microlunatus endophyticus]
MDARRVVELLGRWSSGRGPLYLLLAGRLRQMIDDGDLEPGTRMPPERLLARTLAVGRGTVVNAYEQLRMDGRVVRRQGSGTRVAGSTEPIPTGVEPTTDPMFLARLEPDDRVISMASAAPDRPPVEVIEAYRSAIDELALLTDVGYHPIGYPRLRAALARRYCERGMSTQPDQIMITNGSQQALSLLATSLLRPGDQVAVEAPTYTGALEAIREAGAVTLPLGLGLEGLGHAVRDRRPALAYVIPTNHNPTGTTLPALRRNRLAGIAAEAGIPIIEDEVLAGLTFADEPAPPPIATDRRGTVISVGSLSKSVWAGLRVGWIRAPQAIINRAARIRAIHDLGGNLPVQMAAAQLVPILDELARRRSRALQVGHDHLRAELAEAIPEWTTVPALGGQTLWIRLPRGDGASFTQAALRQGVAILPGDGLDPSRQSTDRIRIHYALDNALLSEAVQRLAVAWSSYAAPARVTAPVPVLAV